MQAKQLNYKAGCNKFEFSPEISKQARKKLTDPTLALIRVMVSRLLFGLVVLPLSLQYSSSALSNPPEEFGGGGLQQPSPPPTSSGLRVGFYQYTCPNAEAIVRDEMAKIISRVPSLAGPLLRMHFHDCFVNVSVRGYALMHACILVRLLLKKNRVCDAGMRRFRSSEQHRARAAIREGGDTEPHLARLRHRRPREGEAGAGLPWSGVVC